MKRSKPMPVIAIVGRPNVGKSTLFNRMTRSRDALVADMPGLTRDRHYGTGRIGERPFLIIDTGGFEPVAKDGIVHEMAKQTRQAIAEADALIFLVDGRAGLTGSDQAIADDLRKSGRPLIVAANKVEGMRHSVVTAEFHELGLGEPVAISSAHGDGVRELVEELLDRIAPVEEAAEEEEEIEDIGPRRIKIAIVGRPNVGKSTLVNTLLGEERVIVFDQPGTTRDSIHIDFDRGNKQYTLIDTAGLRRRGKVFEAVEKFSVVKTLQSVADANVVILVLDAHQEISDQDAHIAGFVVESGRAVVVAINKWDDLDDYERERIKRDATRKLQFLSFAKTHHISALKGQGIAAVMKSVDSAALAAFAKLATPKLTRALVEAVDKQTPPRRGMSRPKLRYAHQGGQNPPVIVIHGNGLDQVPETYRRYLEASFRETFSLQGTPLRVEFRSTRNPFASRDAS
ncbi:MAG: ribosome biogenesis GTPase Der [Burkholderiaceae bacterium]